MRLLSIILIIFISPIFITSCKERTVKEKPEIVQNNITILLDLSDRIDVIKNPLQSEKDKALISSIVKIWKSGLEQKGVYKSLDRISIQFFPQPTDTELLKIANSLTIDLGALSPKERKQKVLDIETIYSNGINNLYSRAVNPTYFAGADLFTFFKDHASDTAIKKGYRNILVVLTDGYLYWDGTRIDQGNRHSYIERAFPWLTQFRGMTSDKITEKFNQGDYGFIDTGKDLSELEVLILEVNPAHSSDYDILNLYWDKWLKNMKIEHRAIKPTTASVNAQEIVSKFFTE